MNKKFKNSTLKLTIKKKKTNFINKNIKKRKMY